MEMPSISDDAREGILEEMFVLAKYNRTKIVIDGLDSKASTAWIGRAAIMAGGAMIESVVNLGVPRSIDICESTLQQLIGEKP